MLNRKKYTKAFKLEAIRMYENSERSYTDIERELGITPGLLGCWKHNLDKATRKDEVIPWACPDLIDTINGVIFAQTSMGLGIPVRNATSGDCTNFRCIQR